MSQGWGGRRKGAGRKSGSKKVERPPLKRRLSPRSEKSPHPEEPVKRKRTAADHVPFAVIDGGDGRIPEPDWSLLFEDVLDQAIARDLWSVTLRELRDGEKLANANLHQVRRYVIACVTYEIAARHVAEDGAVFSRKGKKQPAYNPWFTVMKDANAMASVAEAELTLTPRRRNNGGKVKPKAKRSAASDEFLRSVS